MSNTAPPIVSVIIPLYNAEKYIGECLDSVLRQTFKDYELIVVDDCSTDSSAAIVESYAEKFGGRLVLTRMGKNHGSGACPRNKGMMLSRGEYLAFLDNDDMYTPTALEELYTLAKDYDADVVYCGRKYLINDDGTGLRLDKDRAGDSELVEKPTFESQDLKIRVEKIIRRQIRIAQWRKFVRRRFIFEHELFFPNTRHADDIIWTQGVMFYAKNFLSVPNVTYIHRLSKASIMRQDRSLQQQIAFFIEPFFHGTKILDGFMEHHEFFRQNPHYRYAVLENFLFVTFPSAFNCSSKVFVNELYTVIKQEFGGEFGESAVLLAVLCAALNSQHKIHDANVRQFELVAAQAQKRIAELEKTVAEDKAYINELENFIVRSNMKV